MKKISCFLFLALITVIAAPVYSAERVPAEFLTLTAASDANARNRIRDLLEHELGAGAVQEIYALKTDARIFKTRLQKDADVPRALELLSKVGAYELSEPNYIYRATRLSGLPPGMPNDPKMGFVWGLFNTGHPVNNNTPGLPGVDINVLPLWQAGYRGNAKIVVAVIDTGIQWDHPDLKANLYTNPGEAVGAGNSGKDNDGNGFVDDLHGWNFVAPKGGNPWSYDENGHGTHCAGTIGARGNDGVGIAGVNWEVSLLPVKFLDASGSGTLEGSIEAVNYARLMKVQVMSNSWGGDGFSELLLKSIQAARDAGIVFVAAAGNNASDNDSSKEGHYPSNYNVSNVISVAAIDNRGALAKFSNFGKNKVHVAAPGVNVYSTMLKNNYVYLNGTSMATPHVSGIAALLLSIHPEWTPEEIRRRLVLTSTPDSRLTGRVRANGYVNAWNALNFYIPAQP